MPKNSEIPEFQYWFGIAITTRHVTSASSLRVFWQSSRNSSFQPFLSRFLVVPCDLDIEQFNRFCNLFIYLLIYLHVSQSERYFRCAAPSVWNSLPASVIGSDSLSVFKSRLKHSYFVGTLASTHNRLPPAPLQL